MCPFEALGISRHSSEKQVLKAWRRRMRKCHSDKTMGNDEMAKELNEAKEQCVEILRGRQNPGHFGFDEGRDTEQEAPGERMQREFEHAYGSRINPERIQSLWEILTDQRNVRNGGQVPELDETQKKWMDKDVFKSDIFGMMMRGAMY